MVQGRGIRLVRNQKRKNMRWENDVRMGEDIKESGNTVRLDPTNRTMQAYGVCDANKWSLGEGMKEAQNISVSSISSASVLVVALLLDRGLMAAPKSGMGGGFDGSSIEPLRDALPPLGRPMRLFDREEPPDFGILFVDRKVTVDGIPRGEVLPF